MYEDRKINKANSEIDLLEINHQVSCQLLDVREESEIYKIMGAAINRILPGVLFVVTKLQPEDMNFRIIESSGFDSHLNYIKKLVGKDPFTIDFPFADLTPDQIKAFETRKVYHFPGGLHDLTHDRINKTICRMIEKVLGIKSIIGTSFCTEQQYYGGITLFIPASLKKSGLLNDKSEIALQSFSNQASTVIQRLRDRDERYRNEILLVQSQLQLDMVVENSSSGYLFEDVSRKVVKVNKEFCRIFNIPDKVTIEGMDCRETGQIASELFIDQKQFVIDIERLINDNKPVFKHELSMKGDRFLERDFIPIVNNALTGYLWQYREITDRKKAEIELYKTNIRFSQLINQLTDLVWKANGDGSEVVDLNNSFEKIYGYPASVFNENPKFWADIVLPEDRPIAEKSGNELFTTGNSESEYRIIRSDGSIIWLHDRKSLVYDSKGEIVQMGGIASDISGRKKLEEELLVKNFALESSPTAVGLADMKGILIYANEAYVKLFRFIDNQDVIGRHISEFASSIEMSKMVFETITQGDQFTGEGQAIRKDGSSVDVIISAAMVKSITADPICLMAVFVDTTEQKRLERKLVEQTKQLTELNATKDKFFSIIAHDLKSPFNSILGFIDLLISEYKNIDDNSRLKYIYHLDNAIQSVYKFLENLLDWSRLQRGHIEMNPKLLKLRDIVIESIEPFLTNAIKKELTVLNNVSDNLSIVTDYHSMRVVIGNLFMNAVKYTPNGGLIEVTAIQINDNTELTVRDTGIGIDKEKLDKLFRIEESQSMPGTNNEKGTGLGLVICKEFVAKNNGTITVESELKKGTKFTVTVPSSLS